MTMQHPEVGAARRVPQSNGAVVAAGGDQPAVGTPGRRIDPLLMAYERAHELTRGDVPHPRDIVVPAGHERVTVTTERHAAQLVAMHERVDTAMVGEAPEAHKSLVIACRDQRSGGID